MLEGRASAIVFPSCLAGCDVSKHPQTDCCAVEPCLTGPCSSYKECAAAADDLFDTCVTSAQNPGCLPVNPGRCAIKLKCVRFCESVRDQELRKCRKELADDASTSCGAASCTLKRQRFRRVAARVCLACTSATTTTTTTVPTTTIETTTTTTATTTTGTGTTTTTRTTQPSGEACSRDDIDGCLSNCILQFPSVADCYGDCADNCEGNRCATTICQRSCRDAACDAIVARCTDMTSDGDPNFQRRASYHSCCDRNGTCISADEAPCHPTTSSTTSTTTSTTTTTAAGATTTTATTPTTVPIGG